MKNIEKEAIYNGINSRFLGSAQIAIEIRARSAR